MFSIAHPVAGDTPPQPSMGVLSPPSHSQSHTPTRRGNRVINPNARGYRGVPQPPSNGAVSSRIQSHPNRFHPYGTTGIQQANEALGGTTTGTTPIRFVPQSYTQQNPLCEAHDQATALAHHLTPSTLIWTQPMSAAPSNDTVTAMDPTGMPALPHSLNATDHSTSATVPAENHTINLDQQPLEMVFVPLPRAPVYQVAGGSVLPSAAGPKEKIFFNQTATGLGTSIYDCIHHSTDVDYLFGRGNEPFPLSWERYCGTIASEDPDVMIIEYTWPGYPYLRHRRKIPFRSKDFPGVTIAKRHLARFVAQGFSSMYQTIQDNDRKLRAGERADPNYLPMSGIWELGPSWITLDQIKVVSLEWAYGRTFRAQMAVVF